MKTSILQSRPYAIALLLIVGLYGCRSVEDRAAQVVFEAASDKASKVDALAEGDKITVYGAIDGTQNYFLEDREFVVGSDNRTLVPSAPVFYPDPKQAVAFYAYFGSQSVPTDQSTAAALKSADLCWASASSTPSTTTVPLAFNHVFARLVVTCSQPTSKILIPSAFSGGSLDIRTGMFTNSTKSDVWTTQNELILPVQTLSRLIITSNGVEYVFDGSISLESGKTTTVNLTLNTSTHTASLSGSSIRDWTEQTVEGTPSEGVSNTLSLQWIPTPAQAALVNKIVLTIKDETNGATADYTISNGIAWSDETFTVPFASSTLHYPYTIKNALAYQGSVLLLSATLPSMFIGPTVYKSGGYTIGVKARNPYNPPSPSDYVKIGSLYWAKGNLVATSTTAGGYNGCKVGAPTDGGLYFQFGSLIGYKGGAVANEGTGEGYNPYTGPSNQWWKNASSFSWNNDAMVWPTTLIGNPTSWPALTLGTAHQWFFSGQGATSGQINVNDPTKGVGDACAYYLGGNWRLPTGPEYYVLFDNATSEGTTLLPTANWSWTTTPYPGVVRSGNSLYFPASGIRYYLTGAFSNVSTFGYGHTSSVSGIYDNIMIFQGLQFVVMPRYEGNRTSAGPIRCVTTAP